MKHTKSVIAILITAVICLTSVCPAMAAELSEEATTMDETTIEKVGLSCNRYAIEK